MAAKSATKTAARTPTRRRRTKAAPEIAAAKTFATAEGERAGGSLGSQLGTVALAGLALAAIEVELIPGLLIGVAAMLAPKFVPGLDAYMRPLVKTVIGLGHGALTKSKALVAEASEKVQDMVAEVRSEARSRDAQS